MANPVSTLEKCPIEVLHKILNLATNDAIYGIGNEPPVALTCTRLQGVWKETLAPVRLRTINRRMWRDKVADDGRRLREEVWETNEDGSPRRNRRGHRIQATTPEETVDHRPMNGVALKMKETVQLETLERARAFMLAKGYDDDFWSRVRQVTLNYTTSDNSSPEPRVKFRLAHSVCRALFLAIEHAAAHSEAPIALESLLIILPSPSQQRQYTHQPIRDLEAPGIYYLMKIRTGNTRFATPAGVTPEAFVARDVRTEMGRIRRLKRGSAWGWDPRSFTYQSGPNKGQSWVQVATTVWATQSQPPPLQKFGPQFLEQKLDQRYTWGDDWQAVFGA